MGDPSKTHTGYSIRKSITFIILRAISVDSLLNTSNDAHGIGMSAGFLDDASVLNWYG